MSRSAEIFLPFGEGEDKRFRLSIGPWGKVQEAADMGPAELLEAMHPFAMALNRGLKLTDALDLRLMGTWKPAHVRAVLFHGLVGGGMTPDQANRLCRDNVDERPFFEPVPTAYRVLLAAMFGAEDERGVGEKSAGEGGPDSPAASSATGKTGSTPKGRRRGSARSK